MSNLTKTGRAYGRNQRARRALSRPPPANVPPRAATRTPIAESIALLDARFPWLRAAEKRRPEIRYREKLHAPIGTKLEVAIDFTWKLRGLFR